MKEGLKNIWRNCYLYMYVVVGKEYVCNWKGMMDGFDELERNMCVIGKG
jgi:hypothetical protein